MMTGAVQSRFIVTGIVSTGTASLLASLSTGTGVQSGLRMVDHSIVKCLKVIGELSLRC
jgi:hypothetical protein